MEKLEERCKDAIEANIEEQSKLMEYLQCEMKRNQDFQKWLFYPSIFLIGVLSLQCVENHDIQRKLEDIRSEDSNGADDFVLFREYPALIDPHELETYAI